MLLALGLRFVGLTWGLRHPMHIDEKTYVANVVAMVDNGDLDHRFYAYPGLFFYALLPGIALLGPVLRAGNDPYLVSRAFVALTGVANVALVCFVGERLLGRAAGLAAAFFLAVSPVDVYICHEVRPDILLQSMGLVALLAFRGVGKERGGDLRAGLVMGLAGAVKFTGFYMAPYYLAARWLAPGRWLRGALLAGLVAVAVVLVCTPYALIHVSRYKYGPAVLVGYYQPGVHKELFLQHLATYLGEIRRALGPWGVLLFLAGAGLALWREPRAWGPALLHPLTILAVMSTANRTYARHILPAMGTIDLLAAFPVELLARRSPLAAGLLALVVGLAPLRGSLRYVNVVSRPSPEDRALDWIQARVPAGARIVETRPEGIDYTAGAGAMIGVDPVRYDFLGSSDEDPRALRRLIPDVDLVITRPEGEAGFEGLLDEVGEFRRYRAPEDWLHLGEPRPGAVELNLQVPRLRSAYRAVDLSRARFRASENDEAVHPVGDGVLKLGWTTRGPLRGGEWIELEFGTPTRISRIELFMGGRPRGYDPVVSVWVKTGGDDARIRAADGRPSLVDQVAAIDAGSPRPLSQILLLNGTPCVSVKIVQEGARDYPWRIDAIRVDEPLPPTRNQESFEERRPD
jgi:hypothetical protein